MTNGPIAVVGPTGYTGGRVLASLTRRGVSVRLVGRNNKRLTRAASGLDSAEVRAVTSWESEPLGQALEGCSAVISCAGPFVRAGRPVVAGALQARVPYTDSTGEQPFIRHVFDELDRPAKEARLWLVPAFGFDYVPGDLGAALAASGLGPLERIEIVYAVETPGSSVGTRRTAIEIMATKGYQYVNGELRSERVGARHRTVQTSFGRRTAGSIPGGDVITIPRHLDVRTIHTYMSLPGAVTPASPQTAIVTRLVRIPGISGLLIRVAERGPAAPSEEESQARVACHVEVKALDGGRQAVLIEGRDAYGFTAEALMGRYPQPSSRSTARSFRVNGCSGSMPTRHTSCSPHSSTTVTGRHCDG